MLRLRPLSLVFLLLWLAVPAALRAQSETPAAANKRLFDRSVDELNFQTMETVYDKSFTRRKFPVTLRTHEQRRQFDDYAGNAELKRLFLNYNDIAERFKGHFGKGRTDLAEFQKQLNAILIDKNFEFFIRVLPRDERVALIRSLQRVIKQATAQFNASEDPAPEEVADDGAAVPPADGGTESVAAAPVEDPAPRPEGNLAETGSAASAPALHASDAPSAHDWLDYLTLVVAGASSLMLLYLITSVLPDLRARIDSLADDLEQQQTGVRPARRPTGALPEDRYDDENE
ncbi:hypothetical protein [Hymenobacter sp. BT491]|uniref:hypothetical protein n=1 Tax=Hymenobacter sp. BT491 TaxID=2766779 RepID=UPI00165359D3|nr:hypothetical protein [Hymenobacter sp. BT491]MBC6989158.1 hypothetical protein [Hymenobacter sp. BT491]